MTPVSDDGVLEMLLGVAGRAESGADEPGGCAIELPNLERTGLPNLEQPELTLRQVLEHVRAAAKSVELPRHVALLLRDARAFARDQGVDGQGGGYVSDRRLRRAAQLLQSCAAAHGRRAVTVVDTIAVLPHVLWDDPEEAEALGEWIEAHALPDEGAEQVRWILMKLDAF